MKFLDQKGFTEVIIILAAVAITSILIVSNKLSTKTISTPVPSPKSEASSSASLVSATSSAIPSANLSPSPSPTLSPNLSPKPSLSPAPAPVTANNAPPNSGYSRQVVSVDGQNYTVDIVAADLNSTKVIVDTASESDCKNECPVLPLAEYVQRNGAYAGINGSFFCPAEYPSCSGKTNSFDTLLMNKNKYYFNSDNNVYSTIPAAIFYSGGARFVSQSLQWGRDTSVDAVIANYPLLVAAGNINFTENPNEPKFGQKGPRTFLATKQGKVFIGIVRGSTMGESAQVMKALGMDEALNLDEGGSTALWFNGYKAGPGRNIPNAVLFIRR